LVISKKKSPKTIENQLPEWAKNKPEDLKDFSCDFAHPDSPKINPNKPSNLRDIQLFDVVHSDGAINLIDRRSIGRQKFQGVDLEEEYKRQQADSSLNENKEEKPNNKSPAKEPSKNNDVLLFIEGKLIGSGPYETIVDTLMQILSKHPNLNDEDVMVYRKVSLASILEYVSEKY